jgi:predicted permease
LNSFVVSFNVVAPLMIIMIIGFIVRKAGLIEGNTIKQMNSIAFRLFLPITLFNNILACDIKQDFDASTMVWGTCISLFLTIASYFFSVVFEKDKKKAAALTQCMFRNNFMLFSLPLISSVYGKTFSSYVSMLPAIIIPLNNILGVVLMMVMVNHHQSLKKTILSIILNPFVISSILGFGFLFLDVSLPLVIQKSLSSMSVIATPLLFFLLGAGFSFAVLSGNLKDITACLGMKMITFPILFLIIVGFAGGIRGEKLLALFIIVITPAAVPAQVTTSEMGGDGELAGQLVVSGTAFSMFFIFIWLSVIGFMGWL